MSIVTRINHNGYFVTHLHEDGGRRTYACTDRSALNTLLLYLTGREADSFPVDSYGLPRSGKFIINNHAHIWGEPSASARLVSINGEGLKEWKE